ncbi:DUF2777 family protein [Shouchella lehensis]|uniref:DUF2777 family protein n=1 Tax=Shouchella lehensis TaxID=300825 RepID=A0A4Y7WQ65_9BACI|nr:DUF2777 family protein [Shouchella lehensis]MBG9784557.1 hypothetical protein [Shouchella lehensis]RQW20420.1 DUF2777 family protein [Bacillus sp. C1-1]TES50434.1 DUF2777 family protein [Shouchella lehensis]
MDRYEAQQQIGSLLVIDLGEKGTYLGELLSVLTEPKKPWRGRIQIKSVVTLPEFIFQNETIAIHEIPYSEDDVDTFASQYLTTRSPHIHVESYIDSILTDLKKRYIRLKNNGAPSAVEIEALEVYIKTMTSQKRKKNRLVKSEQQDEEQTPSFVEYTFHVKGDDYFLQDSKGEQLPLTVSHFHYTWNQQGQLVTGRYEGDGIFIRENGSRFIPNEGDLILIDKEQFNPYSIFQTELEPAALQGFEHNLALHHVSHKDLIHCYNALIDQLFHSESTTTFRGVNFLTYQTDDQFVLVQHHFKRELRSQQQPSKDTVYDRFEFTTDKGKRTIALYTNAYQ